MDILLLHRWSKGENLTRGLRIRTTSVQEMLKSMHAQFCTLVIVHRRLKFMKDTKYVRTTPGSSAVIGWLELL